MPVFRDDRQGWENRGHEAGGGLEQLDCKQRRRNALNDHIGLDQPNRRALLDAGRLLSIRAVALKELPKADRAPGASRFWDLMH